MMSPQSQNRSLGFGLVELMVAMTVSMVIGATLLQVFVGQLSASRAQDEVARQQEDARFAFDTLGNDLRQVGFWGCPGGNDPITNTTGNTAYNALRDDAVSETAASALTIRYVSPSPVGSVGSFTGTAGTNYIVSDCTRAVAFTGVVVPAGFAAGSPIHQLNDISYQVANGQLNRAGENLIDSGVTGLVLRYGIRNAATGWASQYVARSGVTNWADVVSVEAELQMTAPNSSMQSYKSAIALRNRLP